MGTSGFIYVLINPSLDGLVKIGKTTRSPVNRVNELSSATGVPTPFQLVYWAEFSDCDSAERALHNIFAERGARVSNNREFFRIQTHEAITAVLSLQQGLLSPEHKTQPAQDHEEADKTNGASLIKSLIRDADEHLSGLGGKFQDTSKAIAILKNAFDLGSADACFELGRIYRRLEDVQDFRKSKYYLLRGIELGSLVCHAELGQTFCCLGEINNADKAWRQFLERATELAEATRGIYCVYCMHGIVRQGLNANLLTLLRPYAKYLVCTLEDELSTQNDTFSAGQFQRLLAVTQHLFLDIPPAQLGMQTGHIRLTRKRGGWITGDDGREYEFVHSFGVPAVVGRPVFFTIIFPHRKNELHSADTVFVREN